MIIKTTDTRINRTGRPEMDLEEKITILGGTPLFTGLGRTELASMAAWSSEASFEKGQLIVSEGSAGGGLFIILRGRVQIVQRKSKPPKVIGELKAGDFFGELSLIDGQARSASVAAIEPTDCLLVSHVNFLDNLRKHPEIGIQLLRILAERLRRSS